jgi:hypothetical protein
MWRSEKEHVANELRLPVQTDICTRLEFSPVEEHFYRKLVEKCASGSQLVITYVKRSASLTR